MKDSKEKEHRISNLKDMIHNIKDDDIEDIENENYDDVSEDSELIAYLKQDSEDYNDLEIDDEFIYHPGDEPDYAINLEDTEINEEFIINTPAEKEINKTDMDEDFEDISEDIIGDMSENFDNIINAKIGRTPVLGLISAFLGLILIIISAFIFQSRSDRVIDHVVSGETNFIFVIVLVLGLLFFIYGIFKVFHIKNPFKSITDSIDTIDAEKQDTTDDIKKPTPKIIPKSKIPLDKESYKIGEFEMDDLKNKLKKPTSSKNKQQVKKVEDDIPPVKEIDEDKNKSTSKESEETEYEQVKLETETIDDIFAEVEDLEDIPIISIDSEEKDNK